MSVGFVPLHLINQRNQLNKRMPVEKSDKLREALKENHKWCLAYGVYIDFELSHQVEQILEDTQ